MVSTLARDQSSRPCSPSRSKTARWSASNTPASAHSFSRRQQVAGEPQPSSRAGSSRQGVEVRAMYTIAAKQLRSEMVRCRPPYGGRGGAGSKGITSAHSSSGTRSSTRMVMARDPAIPAPRSETTSDPKIDGEWAGGSTRRSAAEPGPGRVCGAGLGGGLEGDLVAECLELADVVALGALCVDAGVGEAGAQVMEAGGGVSEQVPDDDQDGAADRDDGLVGAAAFGQAPVAFSQEGVGPAGGHGGLA